ncbi:MAG TPA: glycosyltransferase family 4 protein [Candidatus Dormibacteraeota bacterium]|nr:glycosyltransferase family 4 protein [Candidatus Dormibacteraeota bacterium]
MTEITVLHALDYPAEKPGSFIAGIEALALRLRDRHVRSVVALPLRAFSMQWPQRLADRGIVTIATSSYSQVIHSIRLYKPAVIHAHFSGYIVPATLAALAREAKVFWHIHSKLESPGSALKRAARTMKFAGLARRTDRVFAVSATLCPSLVDAGIAPGKISVVANGVDFEYFREPDEGERRCARHFFGIEEHERTILFFGRDGHVKGADFLAAALRERPEPVTVLCVASPAAVTGLLPPHVRVIDAGTLQDVRPAMWAADVLAMPSRTEGLPLALLEARGSGLPAVVSRIDAFDRFSSQDRATVRAEARDPRAFADALFAQFGRPRVALPLPVRHAHSLATWADRIIEAYGFT